MNSATFVGRLGRDAELKDVNQNKVLSFSVASDTGYGENKATMWVSCSIWGKRAESLHQYLTKGTQVTVVGSLSERTYTNNDGVEKTSLQMRVSELSMSGGGEQQRSAAPAPQPAKMDDEIPF